MSKTTAKKPATKKTARKPMTRLERAAAEAVAYRKEELARIGRRHAERAELRDSIKPARAE